MSLEYEPMEHGEKIDWMLATTGWFVEPVRAVEDPVSPFPTYSYSVGLEALVGHPEISIFGLSAVASQGLLEMIVEQLQAGVEIPLDQPFVGLLDNDLRAMLATVDIATHGSRFPTPGLVYGEQAWRMSQLIWPHKNGAFPWEAEWPHELRYAQPVLATP